MSGKNEIPEKIKEQFDSYYKNMILPPCPKCGNNEAVIPSVAGKPSRDMYMYSEQGHVKLSGCCQMYSGWCKKCEAFIDPPN
jgi:hypothetical protein